MTATSLAPFLDLRARVEAERLGDGGPDTCAALTAGLDMALRDLATGIGSDAAVVALGGYGRREQCLWSDVDVMLLHRGGDTGSLVRAVLYPLWDANIKVGHSVRTLAESHDAAGESLDTLTSLLSARLVAGDEELFADLITTVSDMVRSHPLTPALVAQERERRLADPYPTMTADVKEGRGALRTHQSFWWERRRAELMGLESDVPSREETEAKESLLAIRNALHAAAGRATDQFVVDLRETAAEWLGVDVLSLAAALTAALHNGDLLADRRWPDLHVEHDPMAGPTRKLFAAIRARFSTSDEAPSPADGVLGMAVTAVAREEGAWFTAAEERAIQDAPPRDWTPADRAAFVTLLSEGARGRAIFGRLEVLGWVDREFPEWGPIATAPQLAPFHDHPVGAHLWRTADEMSALIEGGGETGSIADEVGSTAELLLAALLHDIGKARGGNHEAIGAELTAEFLQRAGFAPSTIRMVTDAVRLHLLLSQTATRRDIHDPDVIEDVAFEVGDVRTLQVLYLLTIADLKATGTTMWNDWRASLLESLYRRVSHAIETGSAPRATPDIDTIMEIVGTVVDRQAVEDHIAAMPAEYLDAATPQEVLWHLDVAAQLDAAARVVVDTDDPGRVLIVGEDRSGFLLAATQAFAANGVEVMDARLRTRSDGMAIDTFHVRDDRTGDAVTPERWDRVTADLLAALTDQFVLRPAVRERIRTYRKPHHDPDVIEVRAHQVSRYTAIEVRAPDRVGLLADIVNALHLEGLDIHLAKIDTMGGEARDIFHVRRVRSPIRVEGELEALLGRLRDRLRG